MNIVFLDLFLVLICIAVTVRAIIKENSYKAQRDFYYNKWYNLYYENKTLRNINNKLEMEKKENGRK